MKNLEKTQGRCADHDILIRLDENIKAIKEDIAEIKKENLPAKVATLEARTNTHSKIIGTGVTLICGIFLLLARIAWSMPQ